MITIYDRICPKCGKGLTYFENKGFDARYKCYNCKFTILKKFANDISTRGNNETKQRPTNTIPQHSQKMKFIKYYANMPDEEYYSDNREEVKCDTCELCMPAASLNGECVCAGKYYGKPARELTLEEIESCISYNESFTAFMEREQSKK